MIEVTDVSQVTDEEIEVNVEKSDSANIEILVLLQTIKQQQRQ